MPKSGPDRFVCAIDGRRVTVCAKNSRATLVRLKSDGTPDATFGAGGVAIVDDIYVGSGGGFLTIAVHPTTGKIVGAAPIHFVEWGSITGALPPGDYGDFAVVRFNHDGTIDRSFGDDGIVTTDFGHGPAGGAYRANSVAFLPGGRILGTTADFGDSSAGAQDCGFAFAFYNDDGTLYADFGDGGRVVIRFAGPPATDLAGSGWVDDVVVLPGGDFVVVGTNGGAGLTVARYHADGSPDLSYGAGGVAVSADGVAAHAFGTYQIAALPGGAVAVASGTSGLIDVVVVDGAGQIVQTAWLSHPGGAYRSHTGVAFAPDGKLVVVGVAAPREATIHDDINAWLQTQDVLVGRFAFDFDTVPLPNVPMTVPIPAAPLPSGPAVGGATGATREEALRARREARQAARAAKRAAREARRLAHQLQREQRRQARLQERLRRLDLLQMADTPAAA